MYWTQRFPHPGTRPPKPDPSEPLTVEGQQEWFYARYLWNQYVEKLRFHQVARALEELERKDVLMTEQVIAANLAVMILDGTLARKVDQLAELVEAGR